VVAKILELLVVFVATGAAGKYEEAFPQYPP